MRKTIWVVLFGDYKFFVDFENGRVEKSEYGVVEEDIDEVKLTSKNILFGPGAKNSLVL